jgi:virginiamycin B lyase
MNWWNLSSWVRQIQTSRARQRRRDKPMFPKAQLQVEQLEKRWLMTTGVVEYAIPSAGLSPNQIVAGPDSNLWVTWSAANNALLKSTTSGTTTAIPMITGDVSTYGIVSGPGGLWHTGLGVTSNGPGDAGTHSIAFVGLMTTSGTDSQWTLPTSLDPRGIAVGSDGNLWFAEHDIGKIGKITTSGAITEYSIPTASSGPEGITPGVDGNLWFTETSTNKIGMVTTGGSFTEYTVPTLKSGPFDITSGPDGNLWFTESAANKIGRLTRTGIFTEYSIPTISSTPEGITVGPDKNIWFVENAGNRVASITPTGTVLEISVPTLAAGLTGVTAGPDGLVWFTESSANKIGKVSGFLTAQMRYSDPVQGTLIPFGHGAVSPQLGDLRFGDTLDCNMGGS